MTKKLLSFIFLVSFFATPVFAQTQLRDMLSSAVEHYKAGNCAEALALLDEILQANLPEVKDNRTMEYTLNYYAGHCARLEGESDKAITYLERALTLTTDKEQRPVLNTFLGEAAREKSDFRSAERYYNTALRLLDNASVDAAIVWFFLAETHRALGELDSALADCGRSMKIASAAGDLKLEIACITASGEVYNEKKNYREAMAEFNKALIMARQAQLPLESANNYMGLALVYENLGNIDNARQNYNDALKLYTLSGNTDNIEMLAKRLINLPAGATEQSAKAASFYSEQADHLLAIGDDEAYIYTLVLASVYKRRAGNSPDMLKGLLLAVSYAEGRSLSSSHAYASLLLSDYYSELSQHNAVYKTLITALNIQLKEKENSPFVPEIYFKLGNMYKKIGRTPMAMESYRRAAEHSSSKEDKEKFQNLMKSLQ